MKKSNRRKLRVIHITPWFPNPDNPFQAIWIRRHIESIAPYVDQYVFHIDISEGPRLKFKRTRGPVNEMIVLKLPTNKWIVFEVAWFLALLLLMFSRLVWLKADVIQFHIAYPALTFWRWLKVFMRRQVAILEHWSAYHFSFNVNDPVKLKRIKNIFACRIPVITVSQSLLNDIRRFSGCSDFDSYVLPNVVDTSVFYPDLQFRHRANTDIFMVSQWNWPKEPLVILKAFSRWNLLHNDRFTLRIAGYGNQMDNITMMSRVQRLAGSVEILGRLSSAEIANEMRRALAFAHCSAYETFSVVCAEAICCGTPVIASNVGGIAEFIHDGNGILVRENSVDAWCHAFEEITRAEFDRPAIAKEGKLKFSEETVGRRYYDILNAICGASDK